MSGSQAASRYRPIFSPTLTGNQVAQPGTLTRSRAKQPPPWSLTLAQHLAFVSSTCWPLHFALPQHLARHDSREGQGIASVGVWLSTCLWSREKMDESSRGSWIKIPRTSGGGRAVVLSTRGVSYLEDASRRLRTFNIVIACFPYF